MRNDSRFAVTHGHLDHVGALPLLMKVYPDLKVAIHEAEADHLTGQEGYFYKGDQSFQMKALTFLKVLPASEFKVSMTPLAEVTKTFEDTTAAHAILSSCMLPAPDER